jgi:hypothetical protein
MDSILEEVDVPPEVVFGYDKQPTHARKSRQETEFKK